MRPVLALLLCAPAWATQLSFSSHQFDDFFNPGDSLTLTGTSQEVNVPSSYILTMWTPSLFLAGPILSDASTTIPFTLTATFGNGVGTIDLLVTIEQFVATQSGIATITNTLGFGPFMMTIFNSLATPEEYVAFNNGTSPMSVHTTGSYRTAFVPRRASRIQAGARRLHSLLSA